MKLEWLVIELIVLGVAVFELLSLYRADHVAKKANRSKGMEDPPL